MEQYNYLNNKDMKIDKKYNDIFDFGDEISRYNKKAKTIESILNQAITEIEGLYDKNKDKVIRELQNILSQYKGNSSKENINDVMSKIRILISKLNSKSSNLVKAELE